MRKRYTPLGCLSYTAELWKNSSEWLWVACYWMSMSKTPPCSWMLRVRAAGRCEQSHCTHAVSEHAWGTDQCLPDSNGPQCSIIPIFLIFAFLPLPTDRMNRWQSRRVIERERGNMVKETAGSMRMLTQSLSFPIPHIHILMLSSEDTSMKKH